MDKRFWFQQEEQRLRQQQQRQQQQPDDQDDFIEEADDDDYGARPLQLARRGGRPLQLARRGGRPLQLARRGGGSQVMGRQLPFYNVSTPQMLQAAPSSISTIGRNINNLRPRFQARVLSSSHRLSAGAHSRYERSFIYTVLPNYIFIPTLTQIWNHMADQLGPNTRARVRIAYMDRDRNFFF